MVSQEVSRKEITQFADNPARLMLVMTIGPTEIGQRLKAIREAKGWTQLRLAQEAHVTPGTVSRWERGLLPRVGELTRVAEEVLRVSVSELVEEVDAEAVQEDHLRQIVQEELAGVRTLLERVVQRLEDNPPAQAADDTSSRPPPRRMRVGQN